MAGRRLTRRRPLTRLTSPPDPIPSARRRRRHRIPTAFATAPARGSLTVWFSKEAIAGWRAEPRTTRGGQPVYSDLAIATALTLRAVFRMALRQTEGLMTSILALLGLDLAVPDHSTMSRRAETLEVPRPRGGKQPVYRTRLSGH